MQRREVPNLFQQKEIAVKPAVEAAVHAEEDYYHEDVMSQLGIKFSQHELMNMETTIQVTTPHLSCLNLEGFVCSLLWRHR